MIFETMYRDVFWPGKAEFINKLLVEGFCKNSWLTISQSKVCSRKVWRSANYEFFIFRLLYGITTWKFKFFKKLKTNILPTLNS